MQFIILFVKIITYIVLVIGFIRDNSFKVEIHPKLNIIFNTFLIYPLAAVKPMCADSM